MNATTNTTATNKTISTTVAPDGGLTGNGSLHIHVTGFKPLVVQIRDLSDAMLEQAALHGLKQKIVDAAALSRNPDTGRSATAADKYNAMREVFERVLAGEWNKTRGDGTGTGTGGLLFAALCRLYTTKTAEEIRAFLDGKTTAEQAALRKNPKVAGVIEEIKAERAKGAPDTDTDDMLAELEGEGE